MPNGTPITLRVRNATEFAAVAELLGAHPTLPFEVSPQTQDELLAYLVQAIHKGLVQPHWFQAHPVLNQLLDDLESQLTTDGEQASRLGLVASKLERQVREVSDLVKRFKRDGAKPSVTPWSGATSRPQTLPLKPTDAFAGFCGSEWKTPKGLVTRECARLSVERYIQAYKLQLEGGRIHLDSSLQAIFKEPRVSVGADELPELLERLFV